MKIARFEKVKEWTGYEQLKKIREEISELTREYTKEGELAEGFDIIQSVFTYFFVKGYTKEEIESHLKLHYQKLEQRDEEGRIKIDEWIEV